MAKCSVYRVLHTAIKNECEFHTLHEQSFACLAHAVAAYKDIVVQAGEARSICAFRYENEQSIPTQATTLCVDMTPQFKRALYPESE